MTSDSRYGRRPFGSYRRRSRRMKRHHANWSSGTSSASRHTTWRVPRLNAVRHLNRRASQIAHRLDRDRKHGRGRGPLFGIPIMLKDNIDTADQPTTAGSLALEGLMPRYDVFITRKLREAGSCVILGKANRAPTANIVGFTMPSGFSSLGDFSFNP